MKIVSIVFMIAPLLLVNSLCIAEQTSHETQGSHGGHKSTGHAHQKGGWMLSFRTMNMRMKDSLDGDKRISSDEIVTAAPNRFYGDVGQPATLRVVPIKMDSKMDMFGVMYAQTDKVSWMLMLHHFEKEMELLAYMGASGITKRGIFKTKSSGMGDTSLSALWKVSDRNDHQLHLDLGVSLPTGNIDQKGTVLTPMGMRNKTILPYGMQLGSGTYDVLSGVSYTGKSGHSLDWGAKYQAVMRIGENDENYTLGDKHDVSAWGGVSFVPWIRISLSLSYQYQGDVDGIDSRIMLPVQTADPDNYGGNTLIAHWRAALLGQKGILGGHVIEFGYSKQLDQNVNGIQMEMDDMISVGYRYGF